MINHQLPLVIRKQAFRVGLLFGLLMTSVAAFCQQPNITYYVATNGSDNNAGTLTSPFQTLERARSTAMQVKGKATVNIYLRGGEYYFKQTFSLSNKNWDSVKSLLISSYQGEPVIFSGGIKLDNSKIGPVQDPNIIQRIKPGARNHVFVTSLTDHGITDAGVLQSLGYGHDKVSSQSEVFLDDQPLVLARAPNSGKLSIGAVDQAGTMVHAKDSVPKGAIFHFNYPQASQWTKDGTRNIWVSGHFNQGWSDETVPVAAISDNTIQLAAPTVYGVKSSIKGPNNLERDKLAIRGFYFFNILDELDTAGEYFIDPDHQLLYLWLDTRSNANIHLSVLKDLMITVANLSNISFVGISFQYSRSVGVQIKNSANVIFRHDVFSDLAMDGIITKNCSGCLIDGCKFFNLGASGVILDGGDRINLVPANNVVMNSEFSHDGRLFRSFNPPVNISGVGNTVTHCYFHDLDGQAISYQGNNHTISYNYIRDACKDFSDVGAVGTGRDPSSAGTTIANNFFENVTGGPDLIVTAIYIDDGSGGIKVHNNVFLHCGTSGDDNSTFGFGAIHINGGSDNDFLNNIFINDKVGFSGGLWTNDKWQEYLNSDFIKKVTTKDVNIFSDPYQKSYPFLKNFFDPNRTRNNAVRNSLAYNIPHFSIPQNNIVSNLYTEQNATLQSMKKFSDIANFFKNNPYPASVKGWTDWTPVNFGLIGIQPE
jgi:Right handed beta helix region